MDPRTTGAREQRLAELVTARNRLNTRIYAMANREPPREMDWQQQAHANRRDLADLVRILGTSHITHPRPPRKQWEAIELPAPRRPQDNL